MDLPSLVLRPDLRADWYVAADPGALVMQKVSHLPGVTWAKDVLRVHRTHLPALMGAWNLVGVEESIDDHVLEPDHPLRPHQVDGVAFCRARRGAMLAWEPRTGKTPTAIYAHDPSDGPLVVVAPLSARMVWVHWMRRRWPDVEPYLVKGFAYDRARFLSSPLIFVHYEIIYRHQTLGVAPGTLVLDESQYLSNPRSKRTQAALLFASQARRVIALSGTPKWNTALSLWAQLAACNPGAWGRWWEFARRYAGPHENGHGVEYLGVSNAAEFRERATEALSIKTWRDVAAHLPPFVRNIEIVEVSGPERRELDRLVEEELQGRARAAIADQATFRMCCGDLKIEPAVALARQLLDDGNPVIVWVHHRSVGRDLHKRLFGSVLVTGDVSIEERERRIRAWQSATAPSAIVISLAVGQVAIDLSRAAHEIFVEIDWTPAVVAQAEMRPFDPRRATSATYFCVDHPIERAMVESIVRKDSHDGELGLPRMDAAADFERAFGVPSDHGSLDRLTALFDQAAYEEG